MKNAIKVVVAIALLGLVAGSAKAEQRIEAGSVTSVNNGVVEVTTHKGDIWSFVEEEDEWKMGETCVMLISDNFTPDLTDDKIIVADHYHGSRNS